MTAQNPKNTSRSIISAAAKEAKARETFFSFGDEGLTASVSTHGRLLRITQHFPGQKTGFCVDPVGMPEPYYTTDRMGWFLTLVGKRYGSSGGIGPYLGEFYPYAIADPQHKFINDRWPTFSQSSHNVELRSVGYVASAGTIYQKFEFFDIDGYSEDGKSREDAVLASFSLQPDFMIRDLDFVNKNNEFNAASASENHTTQLNETNKNHITRKHKMGNREIVLHIHVLSKDFSLQFFGPIKPTGVEGHGDSANRNHKRPSFRIQRRPKHSGSILEDYGKKKVLRFVLAYTLQQISTPRSSLPTWETFCKADSLLQRRKDEQVNLSTDPILDIFLKRNLEYILSVCSVPISDTIKHGIPAIALTCGDVEGHRVATAASFYAFQFLLLALDRFIILHSTLAVCYCRTEPQFCSTRSYVCTMKSRIERVCRGHIRWVFQKTRESANSSCEDYWTSNEKSPNISCPNHWVSGEEIRGWESNEWLPKMSLVDACFQLIKAGDLHKRLKIPKDDLDAANHAFKTWIKDLETIDKLDFSAFPSHNNLAARTPTESFYFTDHALIWEAVKSAKSMGLEVSQKYSSDTLRKNIIKRFTTEHAVLKKRMIATKRTPTRTRFLLRSKDTFLFRAMEEGLFDNVNLWNDTMDCQKHHEGNDHTKWEDPRRFAISIAMARVGYCINPLPGKEMLQQAISVLIKSASANGLFAGKLDLTLSPVMYDNERMRDNYWAVVFEVPYLMWRYYCSNSIKEKLASDFKPGPESIHDRLDSICHSVNNIKQLLGDAVVQQAHPAGQKYRTGYWMKHDLPFNNMIAEENIVDLHDEWLYNRPSFVSKKSEDKIASGSDQTHPDTGREPLRRVTNSIPYFGFVVDVPDQTSWKKEESTDDLQLRYFPVQTSITTIMSTRRTIDDAKKRFWASVSKDPLGNKEITETVPKQETREKAEIRRFFRGHESHDNFFTEQTEPLLNLWTTEFHMYFRRLTVGPNEYPAQKVAMGFRFEGDFFDRYWTCRYVEADPQGSSDDDFVQSMFKLLEPKDWTMDQKHEDGSPTTSNGEVSSERRLKVGPWRQRRVLELMLFRRIIERMNNCAKVVLKSANRTVGSETRQLRVRLERLDNQRQKTAWWPFRTSNFSEAAPQDPGSTSKGHNPTNPKANAVGKDLTQGTPIDYRSFLVTSKKLQDFQSELQAVGADFVENKAKINLWLDREEDRQAERPRWTFNDESRYGTILSKLLVKNKRSIQELERNYTMIAGLSELITKELELVRSHLEMMNNDKEQRRAEDMTLFTYVTAVFLPLGFATGLYSMSGVPDGETAGVMLGTFLGVLLLVASIFLAVTKRGPFGKGRPESPSPTPPSAPPLKASIGRSSTSEEGKATNERIAPRSANTTELPGPHSTTDSFSSLSRRRIERDLEAGASTVSPPDFVAESSTT